jgi:hypothetical protein
MNKRKQSISEPYWNDIVSIYFSFCKEKYNTVPTFDNSSPRDLKSIIISLRKRAEGKGVEWNYETATSRFRHFLEWCFLDRWLSENWLLQNLNRQKDKIFMNASRQYLNR